MNCYRIYNNLDRSAMEWIPDNDVEQWSIFNQLCRPGCAQVIGGKVVYRGYLDSERLKEIDPTVTDDVRGVNVAGAIEVMTKDPLGFADKLTYPIERFK